MEINCKFGLELLNTGILNSKNFEDKKSLRLNYQILKS
uniref:39s ribosomal protein mitochondrial n=1 Tax=Triatoma infestans TaxID=30076 RepID=A0A170XER7_TRIIF